MAMKKYSSRQFSSYVEDNVIQHKDRVENTYEQSPYVGRTSHQIMLEQAEELHKLRQGSGSGPTSSIPDGGYRDPQRDLSRALLGMATNDTNEANELAMATLKDPHWRKLGTIVSPEQYKKEIEGAAKATSLQTRNQSRNQVEDATGSAEITNQVFSSAGGRIPLIEQAAKKAGRSYEDMVGAYNKARNEFVMRGGTAQGFNPGILNEALAKISNDKPIGSKMPVLVNVKGHSARTAEGKTHFVKPHQRHYMVNMADKIPEPIQQKVAAAYGVDPVALQDYVSTGMNQPGKLGDEQFLMQVGKVMQTQGMGLIRQKYLKQTYDHDYDLTRGQRSTLVDTVYNALKNTKFAKDNVPKVGKFGKDVMAGAGEKYQQGINALKGKQNTDQGHYG